MTSWALWSRLAAHLVSCWLLTYERDRLPLSLCQSSRAHLDPGTVGSAFSPTTRRICYLSLSLLRRPQYNTAIHDSSRKITTEITTLLPVPHIPPAASIPSHARCTLYSCLSQATNNQTQRHSNHTRPAQPYLLLPPLVVRMCAGQRTINIIHHRLALRDL